MTFFKQYWIAFIFAIYGMIKTIMNYNPAQNSAPLEMQVLTNTIIYFLIPFLILFIIIKFLIKKD